MGRELGEPARRQGLALRALPAEPELQADARPVAPDPLPRLFRSAQLRPALLRNPRAGTDVPGRRGRGLSSAPGLSPARFLPTRAPYSAEKSPAFRCCGALGESHRSFSKEIGMRTRR